MNSKNSRTAEYHVLLLKPADKLNLRRGQKSVALLNLSIYYPWKNVKSSYNNNSFKISGPMHPLGLKNLNYLMDHIQYQISKTTLSIFLRNIVKVLTIHHLKYM